MNTPFALLTSGGGCPCCCSSSSPCARSDSSPLDETLVVFDSHCHLSSSSSPRCDSVVLSVSEHDWLGLGSMPGIVPGFGTHPWEAHKVERGMEERLRKALEDHPEAIVGEIGLCRSALNARKKQEGGWAMQLEVFEKQLSVASSLDRPVSIHCVKAFKELFLVLDRHPCRSVALHSYSGSAHHLRGRDVYVGFSHTLNGSDPKKKDRVDAAIRAVPVDRLLAESDLADPAEACRATHRAVCMIADARGWTPREASEILRENTRRWLRQSPSSLPSFK